ncbi:MAG: (2Fe-2S) ferredoxin domain-containing protein [Clostridia bacterium]|nr:(2Fe-2S) ferredoxin domain-containing protein [Clostridia bacterium]
MKSLEELKAIRERMQNKVVLREGGADKRIVVGMATCGIAAGARPVLNAFVEEIANRGLTGAVEVSQTGCIGMCRFEPIVEVFEGDQRVTYVHVDPVKAREIVARHIVGGEPIVEYTIGAAEK